MRGEECYEKRSENSRPMLGKVAIPCRETKESNSDLCVEKKPGSARPPIRATARGLSERNPSAVRLRCRDWKRRDTSQGRYQRDSRIHLRSCALVPVAPRPRLGYDSACLQARYSLCGVIPPLAAPTPRGTPCRCVILILECAGRPTPCMTRQACDRGRPRTS